MLKHNEVFSCFFTLKIALAFHVKSLVNVMFYN